MFVSIDMGNLVFLHKHHDHETISALSFLEAPDRSIRVETTDRQRFLLNVSDLDMRMLYKNSTGVALAPADSATLRHQLADVVHLIPMTHALHNEALEQVAVVEDQLYKGERFKYALGSNKPAQPGELFPLKARPLTDKELTEAMHRSAVPIKTYRPRLSGEPLKPWEPKPEESATELPTVPTPAPAAPIENTFTKAVKPSVRPVVRAAATAAWEAAGKPTDLATLKALCGGLVKGLEDQGFHPTTIRIKLSEWTKEHAA